MMSKKDNCYNELLEKFKTIQKRIDDIQESVQGLMDRYDADDELRKGCPDQLAADKAAYEAARDICLDSLFDVESKGEA